MRTGAVTLFRPELSDDEVLGLKRAHPLAPALKLALDSHRQIQDQVRDYTCQIVRRERVDGRLRDYEYMSAKVRQARSVDGREVPFSVYLKFLGPEEVQGREVLYVEGRNQGLMRARRGGRRFGYVTAWVHPESPAAMKQSRYPITHVGFEYMARRMITLARQEIGRNDCEVQISHDARVDGRPCIHVQVLRRSPDAPHRYQKASVYMDKERQLPVHFEAHESSAGPDGPFELIEQYTYRDIRLNPGLADRDFDVQNPQYGLK